ncbi:choline-sulfatase [Jiangella rhizosphaerae]|uniref:Choline-sulfatase n=1 Tax=Jiangella rhizosphaerae TaxID=2293569 RepID=A0A418KFU6_9ACTN|nr:choline-sulfatase [Jiangella rhizosphaerae]RIQ10809.1 choline-sulfatase [Jiangella rhizosphaerae]
MATPAQPNIVLIMADQLVPFLIGAYGHPVVRTPHLDRLAARGVRFDAAYTPNPLCAPARAALMTGRYASSVGCFDNAAPFPSDQPTIAHHLTNAGYETALTGKMHFVGPDQLHGFRHRLTTDIFPASMDWVPTVDAQGRFPRGGHAHAYVPPEVGVRPWTKFLTYDEETAFRACEFVRERARRPDAEPFFLLASFHHPHDPFHVTQELWDLYADEPIDLPQPWAGVPRSALDQWLADAHDTAGVDLADPAAMRALRRAYYGLVTYVDRKVGQLLDALEETGRLDDTVVIVTSDHGDMLGERGMVQKRCFYEWSARVPLLVAFPDGRGAGTRVATPVSMMDIAPTVCELAGVPRDGLAGMDARSLLPLVDGDSAGRVVMSEYHSEKVHAPSFMVRRGDHKYVYIHGHGAQLFDLAADPAERRDLAGGPGAAGLLSDLHAILTRRFDPDALAAQAADSIRRRELIKNAVRRNGTSWDHVPRFPQRERYVR